MKKILTLAFFAVTSFASAQWSNTNNQFFDTLHMPVSIAPLVQKNPLVLQSYPDGGYFVIWEDDRNMATTKTDIYAQKYDDAGNRLWAENGVPVANGPNVQRYVSSSNQDYRNRSYAATDSAGGFYIGYIDDSVTNYFWPRIAVQHMRSNGTMVFPGAGRIIAQTGVGESYHYSSPLLVADGNKGFFISYSRLHYNNDIYVYCYKDENGTLKSYGGGWMNQNAAQRTAIGPCGLRGHIDYPTVSVEDYHIWPDGQGGCNVTISMNGNAGDQYKMLVYNKVWRAKKNAKSSYYRRDKSGVACRQSTAEYVKDQVYPLHVFSYDAIETWCGTKTNTYVQKSERILSNGYFLVDQGAYDYHYPKGTTILGNGVINVDMIAVTRRSYQNNTVSDFVVMGYGYRAEKYDSIPFQRTSHSNPDIGFNPINPSLEKLNNFRDTLLAAGRHYPDFSFAGGGNSIYASALMSTSGARLVRLQHLTVTRKATDELAIEYQTPKQGEVIGKELATGFSGDNISYDLPIVKVSNAGTAVFYIREYGRSARISPIVNSSELAWGAMGKPIGTGRFNNSYYNFEQPVVALNRLGERALVAWRDNRNIPGSTQDNIFMRVVDSFNVAGYTPPYKPQVLAPNAYGATAANPAVLMGTSKSYSTIEMLAAYAPNTPTTPVVEILDNNNLGRVEVGLFQNSGGIRKFNNTAYLDRNFTIKTESYPAGAITNLRLFFTTAEFNALKAADASITSVSDLVVIAQPGNTVPTTYTPVGGERVLFPIGWKEVPGGFYIEIATTGLGSFFIQKSGNTGICIGSGGSVVSSLTGANYQWQVNTGSGFTNVTDNSNYNGTTTNTLVLTNIPATWYGYQYRAIVDGVASNITTLRFTNTWTGALNFEWEKAANWSCGIVPDANTDVILNGGKILINSNVVCRSMTVTSGTIVVINPGFTLTVTN
jgi:hypothetical protein